MTVENEIIREYELLESVSCPMRGPDHAAIAENVAYSCDTSVSYVREVMRHHTVLSGAG